MKRIVSVFRFQGYELQSNYPIGSEEFDKVVNTLCNGYISFPGAKIIFQGDELFDKKVSADDIFSCKPGATGVVPVKVIWILGEESENPTVVHWAQSFMGRIEVEESKIDLSLV